MAKGNSLFIKQEPLLNFLTPRLIRKLRIGFGLLVLRLDTIGVVFQIRPGSNLAATVILWTVRITLSLSEVVKIFMPWLSL